MFNIGCLSKIKFLDTLWTLYWYLKTTPSKVDAHAVALLENWDSTAYKLIKQNNKGWGLFFGVFFTSKLGHFFWTGLISYILSARNLYLTLCMNESPLYKYRSHLHVVLYYNDKAAGQFKRGTQRLYRKHHLQSQIKTT